MLRPVLPVSQGCDPTRKHIEEVRVSAYGTEFRQSSKRTHIYGGNGNTETSMETVRAHNPQREEKGEKWTGGSDARS